MSIIIVLTTNTIRGSRAPRQPSSKKTGCFSRPGDEPKNKGRENEANKKERQDKESSLHRGASSDADIRDKGLGAF